MQTSLLKVYFFTFLILAINTSLVYPQFEYGPYDKLLQSYVQGKNVDYEGLLKDKDILSAFTEKMGESSPHSDPEKFNSRNEQLAYWINAYNAFILMVIIENYPVESIKDINFIGFTIWLKKNLIGKEKISFKSLEDDIIRDEFKDPRIHFAINCASFSCPPLRNEAYIPESLEKQMEASSRDFINDENNVLFDHSTRILYLSAIFDWYDDDFLDYLSQNKNIEEPHLLDFIKLYYNDEVKDEWYNYDIVFLEYNWDLNDL